MTTVKCLEMRKRLCRWSVEIELHISRQVVHEFLKIHKALMERLMKRAYLNCFLNSDLNCFLNSDLNYFLSSVRRGTYLFIFNTIFLNFLFMEILNIQI